MRAETPLHVDDEKKIKSKNQIITTYLNIFNKRDTILYRLTNDNKPRKGWKVTSKPKEKRGDGYC